MQKFASVRAAKLIYSLCDATQGPSPFLSMKISVSAEDYPKPASSFALLLCQAQAVSPVLVIIDELDSGLFERCLDPDQYRNTACDCLTAFFYPLNIDRPHPGGLLNVSTFMAPIHIRHKERLS